MILSIFIFQIYITWQTSLDSLTKPTTTLSLVIEFEQFEHSSSLAAKNFSRSSSKAAERERGRVKSEEPDSESTSSSPVSNSPAARLVQ